MSKKKKKAKWQAVSHKIADTHVCPNCRELVDGAMNVVSNGKPRTGDISICCYCATILQFSNGTLIECTPEEFETLDGKCKTMMMQLKIRLTLHPRPARNADVQTRTE